MSKNPSLKLFAKFSQDVYEIPSKDSFVPEEEGWRVFRDIHPEYIKLNTYARAYVKNTTQECDVIVSYRGTEFTSLSNWWTNFNTFLLSNIPTAFSDAAKPFFERLRIEISQQIETHSQITCNYHFTGHSLGAGLAEISAVKFHYPATTFDSPGIYDYVLTRIENGDLSQSDMSYGQNNIFSVLSVPNLVNTGRRHIGEFVSLNHDNAELIAQSSITGFIGYTDDSHSMSSISSMIKEGEDMPIIYSRFSNWPVTFRKDSGSVLKYYTGYEYYISYNHNPYFFEKIFFKWQESTTHLREDPTPYFHPDYDYFDPAPISDHFNCKYIFGPIIAADARECHTRGLYSINIININPGITMYGDNSGVKFTGGTNFDDRYYGGTGDDTYYIFYGDDTIVDEGGVNTYQLLPEIRGFKVIKDKGMKNGVIRVGNFDISGKIRTINKLLSDSGLPVDFELSDQGFIFSNGFNKYVKMELKEWVSGSRRLLSDERSSKKSLEISTSASKNPPGKVEIADFTSGNFGIVGIVGENPKDIQTFVFIRKDITNLERYQIYQLLTSISYSFTTYDPVYDSIVVTNNPFYVTDSLEDTYCLINPLKGSECKEESNHYSHYLRYQNREGQIIFRKRDPSTDYHVVSNEYGFYISNNGHDELCKLEHLGIGTMFNIRGSNGINYYIEIGSLYRKTILHKLYLCSSIKEYIFDDLEHGRSLDILQNGDIIVFISKFISRPTITSEGRLIDTNYKTEFYYKIFDQDLNIKLDNVLIDKIFHEPGFWDTSFTFSKIDFNFDDSVGYLVYNNNFKRKCFLLNFDIYQGVINNRFIILDYSHQYNTYHIMNSYDKFIFDRDNKKFYLVFTEISLYLSEFKTIYVAQINCITGNVETKTIYDFEEETSEQFLSIFKEKSFAITFIEKKGNFLEGKTIFYNIDSDGDDIDTEYDLIQGNPEVASRFGCRESDKPTCIAISNGMADKLETTLARSSVLFGSEGVKNEFIIHPSNPSQPNTFRVHDLFSLLDIGKDKISYISSKIKQMFHSKYSETEFSHSTSQILTNLQNTQAQNSSVIISYFDNDDVLDLSALINSGHRSFQLLNNGNLSEIIFPNGGMIKITPSINTPPFILNISGDGTIRASTISNFSEFLPTREIFNFSTNPSNNDPVNPSPSSPSSPIYQPISDAGIGALPIIGICVGIIGFLSFIFYIGYKKFGFSYNCFSNSSFLNDYNQPLNQDFEPDEARDLELSGVISTLEPSATA